MTCKDEEIKNTKVVTTIVGGKVKYKGQFQNYYLGFITTIKLPLRRTLVRSVILFTNYCGTLTLDCFGLLN